MSYDLAELVVCGGLGPMRTANATELGRVIRLRARGPTAIEGIQPVPIRDLLHESGSVADPGALRLDN